MTDIETPDFKKQMSIGEYTVLQKVGGGGMGVVYKVQNAGGKILALKLLHRTASPSMLIRFKREIEILRTLESNCIPKVYDVGEFDGKPFFVMEYLDGVTLLSYLHDKSKLREKEAVHIIWTIANAIGQAHKLGIIHRDIKPENIILIDKNPCIMDFGVALYDKGDTRLTRTGVFIGTLNYAPPEQVYGKKKQIGYWTDVYAMGATLYHLVTGVLPFEASSAAQVAINILHQNLPLARKYNSHLSKNLELVLQKALQKNIKKRYQNVQAFADDLDAILKKRPIAIVQPEIMGKVWQNPWILVAIMLLVLVILIIGLWRPFSSPGHPAKTVPSKQK